MNSYNNESESMAMEIIANSGDGRSFVFNALQEARAGNFAEAEELIKKANEAINKAHKAQTKLLSAEAGGKKQDISLLLIHSQDHLMTSMLANELAQEMIALYKMVKGGA